MSPLPEEFELQGFLALRPALRYHSLTYTREEVWSEGGFFFRSLDFTKGHQGILVEQGDLRVNIRHHRLISLGKWVADNQPG